MSVNPLGPVPSRAAQLGLVGLVVLTVAAAGARAGEPPVEPLRPADTSSPRDTIRSFRTDLEIGVSSAERPLPDYAAQALMRMLSTLDFSATPNRTSSSVRFERAAMLKDVLDHVGVPPDEEIPGDLEVAEQGLSVWTLPGSRITIARVSGGPQAGQFLFSAATVAAISTDYRELRRLAPEGEPWPSVYETLVSVEGSIFDLESGIRSRLERSDTSSPWNTLNSFLESVNGAYEIVMSVEAALDEDPPRMTHEEVKQAEAAAMRLIGRAQSTLDLSQVPERYLGSSGIEATLQLKEIIDRSVLPPIDSIPRAQQVRAMREKSGQRVRWRFPNTEIEIAEVPDGELQGRFLFSARTVERIGRDFEAVRDLPYRRMIAPPFTVGFRSPGTSEGFYDYYASTPGRLIPAASLLGRLVAGLPAPLSKVHGGQTLWQWLALALCLFVVVVGGVLVVRAVRSWGARLSSPLDDWLSILAPAAIAGLLLGVEGFAARELNITGNVLVAVESTSAAAIAVMLVWVAVRLCMAVAETMVGSPRIGEFSLDASLVRTAARVAAFLIGALIVIESASSLGADVIPLVAGLGVGGLAVALAAQRTFANFIGSLILYVNKPVRVGDFCRYGDGQIGTVEEIGLLSTRIRSLERTLVTVPNADFSEMALENYQARDQRRLKTVLRLRYETTPEQLRFVLAKLRALVLGHPRVTPDPARVRFIGYGEFSKDVEVFCYLDCQDQNTFLAIQEDVLLRMEDAVKEAGTGFAIPAQTSYLSKDTGLDPEGAEHATREVEAWRRGGKLPFPEFEPKEREQLEDGLAYPPEGSPDHVPPDKSGR